jgi:formylglycine-generating enzyme required for sulfatase activity
MMIKNPLTLFKPSVMSPAAKRSDLHTLLEPDIKHDMILKDSEYGAWLKDKAKISVFQKGAYKTVEDFAKHVQALPTQFKKGLALGAGSLMPLGLGAFLMSGGYSQYQEWSALEQQRQTQETILALQQETVQMAKQATERQALLEKMKTLQKDFADTFVVVSGGTFAMGSTEGESDELVHTVTLSPYALQKTEVSQDQWTRVVQAHPELNLPAVPWSDYGEKLIGKNFPVGGVAWEESEKFCEAIGGALPTEAQWEFAARSSNSKWSLPKGVVQIAKDYANYTSNAPRAVGSYAANEKGFYDMNGNVWEWTSDWYGDYSSDPVTNPTGPQTGYDKVLRGGSWSNDDNDLRVANRIPFAPQIRGNVVGFRCAILAK